MQQSLDRLALDSPIIQRIAVGSVFHLLSQHEAYRTKAGAAAIQQCLGSASSVRFCKAMRSIMLYITTHKAHKGRSRRSLYTRQLSSFAPLSRGQARPFLTHALPSFQAHAPVCKTVSKELQSPGLSYDDAFDFLLAAVSATGAGA